MTIEQLIHGMREGHFDEQLSELSLSQPHEAGFLSYRARAIHVSERMKQTFSPFEGSKAILVSGPGRTEIGGNHTDHQHGRVLCASVDLDILACAVATDRQTIRVCSEGFPPLELPLDELGSLREEEKSTSLSLVRGIAAQVASRGYALGGMDLYAVSSVPAGAGLSSSAAFEILIGTALNAFFCGGNLSPVELAHIAQAAESNWFGKPCGLMDQMGSSVGGAIQVDFQNSAFPKVKSISCDFARYGHTLCIVDTGSDHAELTGEYAAIRREMEAIAVQFGKSCLREVSEQEFRTSIPTLRRSCGDRAVLRALHFFAEDQRAVQEAEALTHGDFSRFLRLVNESGLSSACILQNVRTDTDPMHQAVTLALALGRELLEGCGAIRVHGGGFAGTVQAFVPDALLGRFQNGIEAVFGKGSCHILHIRPKGGSVIAS